MEVARFVDEYSLVAPLYGVTPDELMRRDEQQGQVLRRWYAVHGGRAVGVAVTWLRPDDRMFLMFRVTDHRAYGPLTEAVAGALNRSISTMADETDTAVLGALAGSGFQIEMVGEGFRIPFDDALHLVGRAWVPTGYAIRSVADVDERRAFELDNSIRNFVPGTDGWVGDADWFHSELQSDEFDRDTYLIAIEEATDRYVGLVRIWRNLDGPRLGLVGVLPEHRARPVAAALLKAAITAASTWGYDSFITETSPRNPNTYPRMKRMNVEVTGRFVQLTRP